MNFCGIAEIQNRNFQMLDVYSKCWTKRLESFTIQGLVYIYLVY